MYGCMNAVKKVKVMRVVIILELARVHDLTKAVDNRVTSQDLHWNNKWVLHQITNMK